MLWYSFQFPSIIVHGNVNIIKDLQEKYEALQYMMSHYTIKKLEVFTNYT